MMKNGKKYHLKNDKAEHVLLYHFLNDENHAQVVSPRKNEWKQLLLYLYMCILVYTIYYTIQDHPKISSKFCGVMPKSFLYSSNLSSNKFTLQFIFKS